MRRDRANGYIIDTEQKALSIAVVPLAYARELPATERMKRMRYPYKTRDCDRITCISNGATRGYRRAVSSGGPVALSLRGYCVRIRRSYFWQPRTRRPKRRRYGGR